MIPDTGIQEPTNRPTPSLKWYILTRPQLVHFARPLTHKEWLDSYKKQKRITLKSDLVRIHIDPCFLDTESADKLYERAAETAKKRRGMFYGTDTPFLKMTPLSILFNVKLTVEPTAKVTGGHAGGVRKGGGLNPISEKQCNMGSWNPASGMTGKREGRPSLIPTKGKVEILLTNEAKQTGSVSISINGKLYRVSIDGAGSKTVATLAMVDSFRVSVSDLTLDDDRGQYVSKTISSDDVARSITVVVDRPTDKVRRMLGKTIRTYKKPTVTIVSK